MRAPAVSRVANGGLVGGVTRIPGEVNASASGAVWLDGTFWTRRTHTTHEVFVVAKPAVLTQVITRVGIGATLAGLEELRHNAFVGAAYLPSEQCIDMMEEKKLITYL